MPVTGVTPPSRELILHQVDRLVNSDLLKGSESLCRLLRYLAEHALDSPGIPIKEYQIAVEVFGRAADFDPRLDSNVRVQTGRLRAKLGEYYSATGAEDRILIELPKGSYSVTIHERPLPEPPPAPRPPAPATQPAIAQQPSVHESAALVAGTWALGVTALVLLLALIGVLITRPPIPTRVADKAPPVFRTFWHGFIDGPERPWVVFSNAAFVGRPETGIRYFDAHRDSGTAILDHYTGVGEVLAVHELDLLFESLNHGIRVKRGRLLSLDDVKNNDVVFIGSPTENLSLRDVPGTQKFVFRVAASGPRKGDLQIVNLKPQHGEPDSFSATASLPLAEDYSLIALFPGINASKSILILAGISTLGTQAAVEYVTRPNTVEELVRRVGVSDGSIRPFEAVIRVKVTGGVPVSSDLLAVYPRS